jgi:hypothetical protein
MKNFNDWLVEEESSYLYPLKMLAPHKDKYIKDNNLEEGEIVYFQNSRYRGTVIIRAYKRVRDSLPGKQPEPDFPYTIYVSKKGKGEFHLNADLLLPPDVLKQTLDVVEKYASPENPVEAYREICDIIEKYSDENAKKWKIEETSKKFGL